MIRVEQKSPQDILLFLSSLSEKSDRMGYWSDILILCSIVNSMVSNWESTFTIPSVKFMSEDEMQKRFSFLRDFTEKMVLETDRLHQSLNTPLITEDESEEKIQDGIV